MKTVDPELAKKLNTIYIISKGRPQCHTARTLTRLGYPGEWFIVCGNNDETVQQYIDNWGEDRVLVFDWYEEIKHTDTMDNFGFDGVASGAAPVRNATRAIAESRGEYRHWQFDDDYMGFARYEKTSGKNKLFKPGEGQELYDWLAKIAYFGYKASLKNVGFTLSTPGCDPTHRYKASNRVFNAHNMPTDPDLFQVWRGRLNDDMVNALDILRKGGKTFSFNFMQLNTTPTQQETGGLTDLYKEVGTVRKTAYAIMAMPLCDLLTIRYGRYHHKASWQKIQVKILNEKWKKAKDGENGQAKEGNQPA